MDHTATVYSKDNCDNCAKTMRLFDELQVDYTVVKIDKDPEALKMIKKMGYRSAPVVITAEDRWSGYDEDRIREFASGESIWD